MKRNTKAGFMGVVLASSLLIPGIAQANHDHDHGHGDEHSHGHDHAHGKDHARAHDERSQAINDGYFEDAWVKPRPLSDWEGDWQSVYPYLENGTLDPVMTHKAEAGEKSAEEWLEYYKTGYRTDVDRIDIHGGQVTFHEKGENLTGTYESDGYEILNYAAGNRGVRYVFEKIGGDKTAPAFIQFSDHGIAPNKANHYHLYWGDDRAALLEEVTNWPTYYPASLDGGQIVTEMLAH